MSGGGLGARRRRLAPALLIAGVLLLTVGTLVLVAVNSVLLNRMATDVRTGQTQATNLSNAQRENLRLLLALDVLGRTGDSSAVTVRRGLLVRQLDVSAASYPAGSAEAAEVRAIRAALGTFPWDRVDRVVTPEPVLRSAAITLATQTEGRINVLRNAEEQEFYASTTRQLEARRRNQLALAGLVLLVVGMAAALVVTTLRRERTGVARAYAALKGEMSERQAAEQALRASEGRFRSLVQRASDLTLVTDRNGDVAYISPAVETLLGHRPEQILGRRFIEVLEPGTQERIRRAVDTVALTPGSVLTVELRVRNKDGRVRLIEAICRNLLDDPAVEGVVWNGRDVTDRKLLEVELTRQAHHDPLTNLANRTLLLRRLDKALTSTAPADGTVSVVLVDLDGFKNVNDTFGHAAGDELLQRVSERLRGCVLAGDTVARLGGDEFAIVVVGRRPEDAVAVSRRILAAVAQPLQVADQEVSISASIGIAHREGTESAADLLRDADIAMYVAKRTGKARHEVFEPDMRTRSSRRAGLQQDLARALEQDAIEVHYQPIVDLAQSRIGTVEALARWQHAGRGHIPPDVFIPLAEEAGLIIPLGRAVLRKACLQTQEWRRALPGQGDLGVAVNVSVHQVLSGRLTEQVQEALMESGLPATALTLEITESALLEESDRVNVEMAGLKRLGVRIAVDDFGSGYSSLGFLLRLDADILKVDRSLLDFDTTRRGSMVTAVSDLGRSLGLKVVVEGVETVDHLMRARDAHCDAAQGYHFARPLPPLDLPGFLQDWAATEGPRVRQLLTAAAGQGG